jgi:2,5-furandicarboxylate decarboxylase 1
MADQSIRSHLARLEAAGELIRVRTEIDPDENLSAVSWRAFSEQGKSCLFERVKGAPGWRVASQIVASRRKWGLALGVPEEEVVRRMGERIAKPIAPVMVGRDSAPVKEVIELGREIDLTRLPAMWTSERDPGRYIAAGMCIIKDPESGLRNMSIHRAQIVGIDRTGYLICPRQALKIFQMYEKLGRPMQAAMVIGAHPALVFAAGYVAPYGQDELAIAGGLIGEPIRLVKCETLDLEVPAEAELVLEGELVPGEMTEEGPFGEVTGTYAQEGSTPLFRVKAVTRRKDPIFYAMQCGLPPSDTHSIICSTIEMKLWEHLRQVAGGLDLIDVRCIGSMTPMMVVVKIRQKHAGQARSAALAALSSPYLHPKIAVAVDEDIDIADLSQIFWAMTNRADAADAVQRIDATRVFALDNASPIEPGRSAMYRVGTKMVIDATAPFGTARRPYPFTGAAGSAQLARYRQQGGAIEDAMREHLRNVEGGLDLLAVRCYAETENRLVSIKLRPRVGGQSKTALMAALSSPALEPLLAIGIDEDIDPEDLRDVAWSFASRLHAESDVALLHGLATAKDGGIEAATKWFVDSTMPGLTQPERRQAFERAVPKNLAKVDLKDFLPPSL